MTPPHFYANESAGSTPASNSLSSGRASVPPRPDRKSLMMRKYQVSSLCDDGSARVSENIGPAVPAFEAAFSAFARGTLIDTTEGPVAVEDLSPGMKARTPEHGPLSILWIGSMTLVPNADGLVPETTRMTRILADAFGMGRPMSGLMAGPGARILSGPAGRQPGPDDPRELIPARALVDDMNIIPILPPRPVTVYHMCLRRHATVSAGGLEMETFHPGPGFERNMGANMLSLFLSFFPHLRGPTDFGSLAHPRRALVSAEGLEVA